MLRAATHWSLSSELVHTDPAAVRAITDLAEELEMTAAEIGKRVYIVSVRDDPTIALGLCSAHYQRLVGRGQRPSPKEQ